MISEERLEAVVRDLMAQGLTAGKIARRTGVPAERVQRMMHRVNGRDPAAANRDTRHDHRKERRREQERTGYGWR